MYKRTFTFLFLMLLFGLLSCGPSPEAIATMTAAAWTPTPEIPYDLKLTLTEENGTPVSFALVQVAEVGEKIFMPDAQGEVSIKNLPGPSAKVSVNAPGYFSEETQVSLVRGVNEVNLVFTPDPEGLLPVRACRSDEKPLYIEDFQDGEAQGWSQMNIPGWSIQADTEKPENKILVGSDSSNFLVSNYKPPDLEPFTNAVWRVRVKVSGVDDDMFLNWLLSQPTSGEGDRRYIVQFSVNDAVELIKFEAPQPGPIKFGESKTRFKKDHWYIFEISTFNGKVAVWLDGKELVSQVDPKPFVEGTIGLELHLSEGSDTTFYFDEMAVCGLSAPFISILADGEKS